MTSNMVQILSDHNRVQLNATENISKKELFGMVSISSQGAKEIPNVQSKNYERIS